MKKLSLILILILPFLAGCPKKIHAQQTPLCGNCGGQLTVVTPEVRIGQGFGQAYRNIFYRGEITVSGGRAPYTVTIFSGSPPLGIPAPGASCANISPSSGGSFATCVMSGTPTGSGTSSFTVRATDQNGAIRDLPTGITVNTTSSVAVTPTGASVAQGSTLQMTCKATETDGVVKTVTTNATWAPTTFGTGGSINSSGLLTAGTAAATPSVTCAFDSVTSPGVTVTIPSSGSGTPVIQTASPISPNGKINQTFNPAALVATGGTGPYTWTNTGVLPTGVTLSSAGVLSGTPTNSGTFTPAFTATDSLSVASAAKTLNIVIASVTSNAVTADQTTIPINGTTQLHSTTTYSDSSTFDTTVGNAGLIAPTAWTHQCASVTSCTLTTDDGSSRALAAGGSGHAVMAFVREGNSNTDTLTVADSASQNWTTGCGGGSCLVATNTAFGTTRMAAMWIYQNSAAITSWTVSGLSAANGTIEITIFDIPGAATTSVQDPANGVKNQTLGGSYTSLSSGSLTTTNAADMLLYCVTAGVGQSGFAAGTGYVIPSGGTGVSNACEYQIVSATQSAVTTSISWSISVSATGGIFVGAKAAASGAGGASWNPNNGGTGSCSVTSAGLLTGLAPAGTCFPQATVGGQVNVAGTPTITIQSAVTDTRLNISPSTASAPLGGTTQFQAVGNITGANYTGPPTIWGSSNTNVATVTAGLATCSSTTSGTVTITATNGTLQAGTATLSCNPVSSAGLLTGCTVDANNNIRFGQTPIGGGATCPSSLPGGWSLVRAQGFELGLNSDETTGGAVSVTSVQAHTGSKSLGGPYNGDGNIVAWTLKGSVEGLVPNALGTFSTVYISFWDYVDPIATFGNSDYAMATVYNNNCSTGQQSFGPDAQYFPPPNVASVVRTGMVPVSQGDGAECQGTYQYDKTFFSQAINAGRWMQVEMFYHPSTTFSGGADCTDGNGGIGKCHGDGEFRYYLDGVQVINAPGRNLNGRVPMANSDIDIGGVITAFWFQTPNGTRCPNFANPDANCTGDGTFPGQRCPKPFSRYIDDIIIMKQ